MMNDECASIVARCYRVLETSFRFRIPHSAFRIHYLVIISSVMLNLQQQLNEEWKTAMRNKDALRRDTLSGLRAAIKRAEIDARTGDGDVVFDDAQSQAVIEREAKKRRDSIDEYTKANRDDLAQKERDELAILQEFLPQQLSDAELESLVKVAIDESGAKTPKEMGVLMKNLMPRVQGRADGKRVNEVVKRLLA